MLIKPLLMNVPLAGSYQCASLCSLLPTIFSTILGSTDWPLMGLVILIGLTRSILYLSSLILLSTILSSLVL